MKINFSAIELSPAKSTKHNISLKSEINVLILVHLLLFILLAVTEGFGYLEYPFGNSTFREGLVTYLALSSNTWDFQPFWWTSLITYPFVHLHFSELFLSMCALWFFGHLLSNKLGERQVVIIYFVCTTLTAMVFILANLVFPVFSGPNGIMDGSFSGVLGVMTAALFFYRSCRIKIGSEFSFPLWQLYATILLISLLFVYKNNIAYIMVYIASIALGIRYTTTTVSKQSKETYKYN